MHTLVVLHKLEESFGYYDVTSGEQKIVVPTRQYPHEICIDEKRKKIYIAEMGVRGIESSGPGGNTVAVYDIKTKNRIGTIGTGKYDRPHGIAISDNKLVITSESTKNLLVFNLQSEELIKAIYLDQDCAHMVNINPEGTVAFTANIGSNTLSAVDLKNYSIQYHIDVPERPEGIVFSPNGKYLYCVCREAAVVALVDIKAAKMISTISTGKGPVRIVISPDGKQICFPLFHSASVQFADTSKKRVTDTLNIGLHPAGICLSPDGKLVFISCEEENLVYVIDFKTHQVLNTIRTGKGPDAMVCLNKNETG